MLRTTTIGTTTLDKTEVNFNPFRNGELVACAPTTEAQKELWTSIAADPRGSLCYNESLNIELLGALDVEALAKSLTFIVDKFDSLRASFSPDGKHFLVYDHIHVGLPVTDLSDLNEQERSLQLNNILASQTATPFDLEKGPLFKCELVKLSNDQHRLLLNAHHMICDGWSLSIIIEELSQAYEDILAGKNLQAAVQSFSGAAPKPFYEVALSERRDEEALIYWKKLFSDIPSPLNLPIDFSRPRFRSFSSKRFDLSLDRELFKEAKKNAAKNKKSVYQYLFATFNACLFNITKNTDFNVGISLAGQAEEGMDRVVGHLVRFLPIRTQLKSSMSFEQLLEQIQRNLLNASEYKNATFGEILKNVNAPRDPSRVPLIDVVFNVDQQYPGQGFRFKKIKASYCSIPRVCDNFELKINASVIGDDCVLECQYNDELYRENTIKYLLLHFEDCLRHFNQNTLAQLGTFSKSFTPQAEHSSGIEAKLSETAVKEKKSSEHENMVLVKSVWEEVMGFKGIPENANFFSIGGHSLLAVDICHRIFERTGTKFTLKDLVLNPSIESFAALLPNASCAMEAQTGSTTKGLAAGLSQAELTMSQFQAWYQEQIHQGTTMHNLPSAIRVSSDVDMNRLREAYRKLMKNYPALRTCIQSGPVQKVFDLEFAFGNLSLELKEGMELPEVIEEMQSLTLTPYDLEKAPLFRSRVYKVAEGDFVIFNCFHHMIFDGWSFDIFFQALSDAYEGKELLPEEASFLDYAKWQKGYFESDDYKKDLAYWMKKLSSPLPILELPTDFPRPAKIKPDSSAFAFTLDGEMAKRTREFCKANGVSPFNVFLSCFKMSLMEYSRSQEVIVGIPVRGRNNTDQLNTIGYFVNAVAIRSAKESSVKGFLEQIQAELAQALEHQNAPFEKVRESLKLPRDTSRPPVTQTFFSFQEVGNRKNSFNGAPYSQINLHKAAIHTDLDMWIKAGNEKIEGAIEYRSDLFKSESIERFFQYFKDMIAFVVSSQGEQWSEFRSPSLWKDLAEINDTLNLSSDKRTIVDFVDEMAQTKPQDTAVVAGDKELSYGELARLSDQMASYLSDSGVRQGDLVGICQDRDERLMVTVLGVMKAGAGYVPLDPYFPPERLDYMVEQSQLKMIVTHECYKKLYEHHPARIATTELIDLSKQEIRPKVKLDENQTAYVIYTSGSTGRPKGVNISYKSAMNFLRSMLKKPGFNSQNRLLAVTTFCFDISVLELFLPLVAGASVYIATKAETMDGEALRHTIETKGIDVLQATPPTWRILLAAGWRGSKTFKVLCGGEAFPRDLAEALIPICDSVWNMYGPTEATVWATCKKLESHKGTILVGSPLENYRTYILNEELQPVPFGAIGELFIGGEGLALGYYKRDDLTDERFIPDTIRGEGKMYRTGDLARFHANGEIECLGRNDDQVKIRGYRIELGEVEASLAELPEIEQTVAMAREDRPGDIRLVAYVRLGKGAEFDQFKLREKLGRRLPPYMIPANFIALEEFPTTLTGKVDRKQLPPIDFVKCEDEGLVGRRTQEEGEVLEEVEIRLSKIWTSVVGIEDYDLEDSFFDVGGNSLLSVDLFNRINKEFSVDLPLATLVSNSKFGQLLEVLESKLGKTVSQGKALSVPSICASIVAIKEEGTKTPIFCFHGVGGNILNYIRIAPHLGEHPLYGVQSQGVDGKSTPLGSIEDMAQKYMEEIRLVQPHGPYLLAGGSMGGLLAFETARKLLESGEKVHSIIMLDTYGPGTSFKSFRSKDGFLSSHLFSLKWKAKKYLVLLQCSILKRLGLSIPHSLRHFHIEVLNYQALWSHQPGFYNGDIDLVRAPIEDNDWYRLEDMGWGKVVDGEVRVHYVEGEHSNFVEAKELPRTLKNVLSRF